VSPDVTKCTKFDFGWTPPHTPLGELTVPPDPQGVLLVRAGRAVRRSDGDGR